MDDSEDRANADLDGDAVEPPLATKSTWSRLRRGALGTDKKCQGGTEESSRGLT